MKKSNWKSNLDELQEQQLLHIERNGCWLAFWGLFAALAVEYALYAGDMDFRAIVAEWIVFMALACYLAIACIHRGIWDRHLKMNRTTIVLCSLTSGCLLGVFNFFVIFRRFPAAPFGALAGAVFSGAACSLVLFLALALAAHLTKKRQDTLNAEPEEGR